MSSEWLLVIYYLKLKYYPMAETPPPPPLQVNTGLPGYKNDIITRKVALQARRGYQDPC
jgi:hypothetical protein